MSDGEPIAFRRPTRPMPDGAQWLEPVVNRAPHREPAVVVFTRLELNQILNVYGRRVAEGEWRDYAIDMGRESAVFSIFRRASEVPIYRVEKTPKLARRQGAYAVITATGLILKRGHELMRVLAVLEKGVRMVGRE